MQKIIIMVGLPGSGKTTYIKENLQNYTVISPDEIRIRTGEGYGSTSSKVWGTAMYLFKKAINEGKDIVFDSTALKRKDRSQLVRFARKNAQAPISLSAIVMETSLEVSSERAYLRSKDEWEENPRNVVARLAQYYAPISNEEKFDNVIYIK